MNKKQIEAMIYIIRDQKVMLDSDLAELYELPTKRLTEQVKRNIERFPDDFLIIPNSSYLATLRSQIATLEHSSGRNHVFNHTPFLFTENGVAMLSSVLRSKRAILVNIEIMRTFTKLRSYLAMGNSKETEVKELKAGTNRLFKIVFERLDNLEESINPKLDNKRKRIGLKKE